jgi:hypothetical protein
MLMALWVLVLIPTRNTLAQDGELHLDFHVFLPRVDRAGVQAVACGPADLASLADGISGLQGQSSPRRWRIICGGFGRIRDLVRVSGDGDDEAKVLAVGDGAATLVIGMSPSDGDSADIPSAPAIPGAARWVGVDIGPERDLGGLLSLYVLIGSECEKDARATPCLWAVGERARLAFGGPLDAQFNPRWQRYDDVSNGATDVPTATLHSLVLRHGNDAWPKQHSGPDAGDPIEGWAVGSISITTQPEAYMAQLSIDAAGVPTWRRRMWDVNLADGPSLPPLTDIQVLSSPPPIGFDQAWALGGLESAAVYARMVAPRGQDPATWERKEVAGMTNGTPREIALRSATEGWAFGMAQVRGNNAAALWQLAPWGAGSPSPTPSWSADPVLSFAGQSVVDAYQVTAEGFTYLALSPIGRGSPVVHRLARPEGVPPPLPNARRDDWRPKACWQAELPASATRPIEPKAAAHRAFAPLDEDWGVYALGDQVWLLPMDADDPRDPTDDPCAHAGPPRLIRERLRLEAFAPRNDGDGWAISRNEDGQGELVELRQGRLARRQDLAWPWNVVAIDHAHPPAGARAQGRADEPTTWALSADGRLWSEGESRAWQPVTMIADPAFDGTLDVLEVVDDGAVWAAGADAQGNGKVLRFQGGAWRDVATIPLQGMPGPLRFDRLDVARAGDAYFGIAGIAGRALWLEFVVGVSECGAVQPGSGEIVATCANACCVARRAPQPLVDLAVADREGGSGMGPAWVAFADQIYYRLEGELVWGREELRAPAPHCPDSPAAPCRPRLPSSLVRLAAAGPNDLWAVWHDGRIVEDAPELAGQRATSHVIRRRGPWSQETPWTLEAIVPVPIHDLRLGAVDDGAAESASRQLWLAGDWSTLLSTDVQD